MAFTFLSFPLCPTQSLSQTMSREKVRSSFAIADKLDMAPFVEVGATRRPSLLQLPGHLPLCCLAVIGRKGL